MSKTIKIVVNSIIVLIVLWLVLYFSLKDNFFEIVSLINNINIIFIIMAILLLCFYRFFIGASLYLLVKNSKEKISLKRAFQISFIIMFFHGVTPFASGGQPMEIYYLHNEKIPVEKATNIVLQNFILFQTSLILVGLFAFIYNYFFKIFPSDNLIRRLVLLGFLINFGVWLVSLLLAFGKKSGTKVVNGLVKLGCKLHIIKDKDKALVEASKYCSKFYGSAVILKENKLLLCKLFLINVLGLVVNYSIPYVLAVGFKITDLTFIESLVCTSYVMIIGSFVPIPGGTGGIEFGFMHFFGYLLSGGILSALMLLWRFITYYIGMIIGAICLMFYRKRVSNG